MTADAWFLFLIFLAALAMFGIGWWVGIADEHKRPDTGTAAMNRRAVLAEEISASLLVELDRLKADLAEDTVTVERACDRCGCTDAHACPGGCWWVAPNLCSTCQHLTDSAIAAAAYNAGGELPRTRPNRHGGLTVIPSARAGATAGADLLQFRSTSSRQGAQS